MTRDLVWAVRWLRHNPRFSAAVIFILALGIGVNTAVFSVVDAVLIRPLPYASAGRLVSVGEKSAKLPNIGVNAYEYLEWRKRTDVFDGMAAYYRDMVTITGQPAPDQVWLAWSTPNLFSMLGARARMGRAISEGDDAVVVLSDKFWRRRFQADPRVIGRTVNTADNKLYTIIGVMPPEFEFPHPLSDMWAPLQLTGAETRWVDVAAQLRPEVTAARAESAMAIVARQTEAEHPKGKAGEQIVVTAWRETPAREYELTLMFLLAAVALVLSIACADVAGLLLSRAVQRRREIAIRAALGAGFARVVRQLLAESLLLAMAGTVAGVAAAKGVLRLLTRQLAALPIALPHLHTVDVNQRVLLFSAFVCVLLACAMSVAPVVASSGADLNGLMQGGRAAGSRRSMRLFSVLIGAEAMFAFLLLTGSGLMIRSLIRLQQGDHGIHADHVLTMRVPVGTSTRQPEKYNSKPRQMAYYRELVERLRQVPGVRAVAVVNNLPLSGANTSVSFELPDGRTVLNSTRTISAQYFDVMGIPLIAGRTFTDADQPPAAGVAIINESLARQVFPGQSPIGLPLHRGAPGPLIVGVVKDTPQMRYDEPVKAEIYLPYQQMIFGVFLSTVVVRTSGDPLALASTLQKEIWVVDPSQPVVKVETMEEVIADSMWRPRFSAWIFSALGALALLLTSAGVYSVVAYTTMLRAREVGIRVALGAVRRDVVGLLVRQALVPLAVGLVLSVGASLALARLMKTLLYETSPGDPVAYLAAGVVLLGIGAIASAVPAWKAAGADPLDALRTE